MNPINLPNIVNLLTITRNLDKMLHDRNILNKNNSADNADIQYQIDSLYHGLELLIKNYEPQQPTQPMPYHPAPINNQAKISEDKNSIDLIKYIPLYKKYFNCKEDAITILIMNFQYLFRIVKHVFPKPKINDKQLLDNESDKLNKF